MPEESEKKVGLVETIFIGLTMALVDIVNPFIGGTLDLVVSPGIQMYAFFRGLSGMTTLAGNIVELIPVVNWLPLHLVAWIITVYLANHPKTATIVSLASIAKPQAGAGKTSTAPGGTKPPETSAASGAAKGSAAERASEATSTAEQSTEEAKKALKEKPSVLAKGATAAGIIEEGREGFAPQQPNDIGITAGEETFGLPQGPFSELSEEALGKEGELPPAYAALRRQPEEETQIEEATARTAKPAPIPLSTTETQMTTDRESQPTTRDASPQKTIPISSAQEKERAPSASTPTTTDTATPPGERAARTTDQVSAVSTTQTQTPAPSPTKAIAESLAGLESTAQPPEESAYSQQKTGTARAGEPSSAPETTRGATASPQGKGGVITTKTHSGTPEQSRAIHGEAQPPNPPTKQPSPSRFSPESHLLSVADRIRERRARIAALLERMRSRDKEMLATLAAQEEERKRKRAQEAEEQMRFEKEIGSGVGQLESLKESSGVLSASEAIAKEEQRAKRKVVEVRDDGVVDLRS